MRIYDNQGRTIDRYTVILDGEVYTMSSSPLSPEGVNMYWGAEGEVEVDLGQLLPLEDLPKEVREAIRQRQSWGFKVEVPDQTGAWREGE